MNTKKRIIKLRKKIAKLRRFKKWADRKIEKTKAELMLLEIS